MKPGIPWSVKGIGNEAREAAKFAARKSGMTLGEWLNEIILDSADDPPAAPPDAAPAQRPTSQGSLSLEDLAEQLQRLNSREHEAARFPEPQPHADQMRQSSDALARVLARIETGERQTVEALSAVNERISALSREIGATSKYRPPERPEDVPGYQALEGALRNIVDHIQTSEKRSRENFAALQTRMGELAERAASADDERVKANAGALMSLEERLADLAQKLHHSEAQAASLQSELPRQIDQRLSAFGSRLDDVRALAETAVKKAEASATLDLPGLIEAEFGKVSRRIEEIREISAAAEMRAERAETAAQSAGRTDIHQLVEEQIGKLDERLGSRLDSMRDTSEQAAQRAQSAAIQTAQQELKSFEGRVQAVMKEAQAIIRQTAVSANAEVAKVKSSIEGVSQRVDDVTSRSASERDVAALRQAIEQLTQRVTQQPDMRPIADLDRRVSELTARIERMQQNNNSLAPQLLDLDRRVQQIDGGLRDLLNAGPQPGGADTQALEQYIHQLNERLGRTEQHLGHFGVIEQSLQQLFAAIEQSKGLADAAAEDAATRMGERLMRSVSDTMQQTVHAAMQSVQQHQDQQQQQLRMQLEQQHQVQQQVFQGHLDQQMQLRDQELQQRFAEFQPVAAMPSEPAGPSPELIALQEGLQAVKASAAQSDKRTQETLEAVHETLEQIVGKLAELEEAERQAPPPAAHDEPPSLPPPAPPPAPAAEDNPFAQFFEQQAAPAAPAPEVYQPQAAQIAPLPTATANWQEPPAVNPFQPGAQADPQQQWSAAAPAYAPPQPDPQAYGTFGQPAGYSMPAAEPPADEYISAARRAAQSAAVTQAAQAEMQEKGVLAKAKGLLGSARAGKSKSGGPFPVSEAPTSTGPVVAGVSMAGGKAGRRKTLIVAGAVLLAALSAYGASQMFSSSGPSKQSVIVDPPKAQEEAPKLDTGDAKPPEAAKQVDPVIEEAPDSGGAVAPKPKPAELEGNLRPDEKTRSAFDIAATGLDALFTGALPGGKSDATIDSIVAEPNSGPVTGDMPPAEVGSEALRKAAAGGDAAAQFVVASRYLDGKDVEQDLTQAARWYQMAAQQGLAPAQYRLATLFERGRGVPQDIATAGLWYERAAERGNVKAMHNAAVILSGNQAGQPNYEKAAIWFRAAAEHGLKDSQYNYAVLLERGLGIKQNMGEALFWYGLAAAQDDKDAVKKLQMLEQSLAPSTVAEARKKTKTWRAKPAVQDANMVPVSEHAWNAVPGSAKSDPILAAAVILPEAGSEAALVEAAQAELTRLGYNVPSDGKLNAKTANAVRLFQLKQNLKVTGEITAELVEALKAASI